MSHTSEQEAQQVSGQARSGWDASRRRALAQVVLALVLLLGLALAWRHSSLHELIGIERLTATAKSLPPSAGLLVSLAGFLVGSLLVLPLNLLTLVTVLGFGAWPGALYAYLGSMAAGVLTFWLGRLVGGSRVRRLLGARAERVRAAVGKRGIPSIAVLRATPLAPFTVVNLIAGAIGVRLGDFFFGSLLGLLPGLLALALLGGRLLAVIRQPTPARVSVLLLVVATLFGLGLVAQRLMGRLMGRPRAGGGPRSR